MEEKSTVPPPEQTPQRISGTTKLVLITALVTAVFAVWNLFFVTVELRPVAQPNTLYADGASTCEVRLIPIGRLGMSVPFRDVPFRFRIIEGGNLVHTAFNADSTVLQVQAGGEDGLVEMSVTSEEQPIPTLVTIYVVRPRA